MDNTLTSCEEATPLKPSVKRTAIRQICNVDNGKKLWRKVSLFLKKNLLGKQSGQWFMGTVLVPLFVAAFYFVVIASPRYVSNATFMIERNDGTASIAEGFNLFGISAGGGNDLKILENFIRSPDMLDSLQENLNLREHYTDSADWLSNLDSDASYDEFLEFYRSHTAVRLNESSGLLELSVQAFNPEMAENIASEILRQSESFVNKISHDLAIEQQAFVKKEVDLLREQAAGSNNKYR